MSKTVLLTLVVLALATLTVAVASARHGDMGDGWSMGAGPLGRMARHLDLADEQRNAIREVIQGSREKRIALRDEFRQLREDIANTIKTSGFDEDEVRLMLENRSSLMIDLAMLRIKSMADVYEILTPEQRQKVDAFMAQGPRGRHGRRGHWHEHASETPPED